ncbi:hypothetical protein DSCW_05220 [Desulfosarcina widdelii]|uniref:Uncharacterized protein n=1 Tax=Desulfosarcina widdelii TaxID=947919 RepID=A0A5K7YXH6_9BACT|nr:hypothetical protein DSCW_05220 [Desulfosarcina widdelii]
MNSFYRAMIVFAITVFVKNPTAGKLLLCEKVFGKVKDSNGIQNYDRNNFMCHVKKVSNAGNDDLR